MIYFDRPTQQTLVNKLAAQLRSGGYLMIGHSESLNNVEHPLTYVEPTVYTPFIGKTKLKGITANIAFTPKNELTVPAVTLYSYKDNVRAEVLPGAGHNPPDALARGLRFAFEPPGAEGVATPQYRHAP